MQPVAIADLTGEPTASRQPPCALACWPRASASSTRPGRAGRLNANLHGRAFERCCALDDAGRRLLERSAERLHLSARGFHRVLKVARTIADLAAATAIAPEHLAEALQYRLVDDVRARVTRHAARDTAPRQRTKQRTVECVIPQRSGRGVSLRRRHPYSSASVCFSGRSNRPKLRSRLMSRRYTIVLADRRTGVVRRFTVGLWPTARGRHRRAGAARAHRHRRRAQGARATSPSSTPPRRRSRSRTPTIASPPKRSPDRFRACSRRSPSSARKAALDPALQSAMDKLPAVVKNRAMGGGSRRRRRRRRPAGASIARKHVRSAARAAPRHREPTDARCGPTSTSATRSPPRRPRSGRRTAGSSSTRRQPRRIRSPAARDFHQGLDISADHGSPVYATADGTITQAAREGGYGNLDHHRSRLRPRDALRPPVALPASSTAPRSSAATSSGSSVRPAARPARISTTKSVSTDASSIRSSSSR